MTSITALQYNNITVFVQQKLPQKREEVNFSKYNIYNLYINIYIYKYIYILYINFWLEVLIFGLSKLLSVICYLLLPFFALTEKCRFWFISFTAPNIIPMILPQLQANKSIVFHLSSLYSAIYDNHQDLYFKIWLCNQLIHREM